MFLGLFGKKVTFTAKVTATPPGAGTPEGTVTFFDGARNLGTSSLDGTGKATFSINPICLRWGRHLITATYSGSADFNGSTSPALTQWVL
jgi:Bacterial Ig-like domain (group 3)